MKTTTMTTIAMKFISTAVMVPALTVVLVSQKSPAQTGGLFVLTTPQEGQAFRPGDVIQVSIAPLPGVSLEGVDVNSRIGRARRELPTRSKINSSARRQRSIDFCMCLFKLPMGGSQRSTESCR
jgi:hypothetical protein